MTLPKEFTEDSAAYINYLKGGQVPEEPKAKSEQDYIRRAAHNLCEEIVDSEFGDMVSVEVAAEAVRLAVADERASRTHGGGLNRTTF